MDSQAEQLHPNWRALSTLHIPMKRFIPESYEATERDCQRIADEKHKLDGLNGQEIQEFYKRVIEENINISKKCKQENIPYETKHNNVPKENFDKHRFHCYAMENKAEKLLQINYKESDINILDGYGWSALMMSACAGATEAVRILLSLGANQEIKDKSQRTAKDLAMKNGHYHIVKLLENSNSLENQPKKKDKISISNKPEAFHCSVCNHTFMETTQQQHYTSTVHQFSVKSSLPSNKLQKFNIPSRNKGLQLMIKQGWDKESGLGPSQNGRLYPIKTTIRKQRSGLGIEQQVARVTHFRAFDRKAVQRHNSDYYNKKPRNRNDIRKEKQREWKREKRLRRELS